MTTSVDLPVTAAVRNVIVDRLPGGRAKVEWSIDEDCREVQVAWGSSPDGIDHDRSLRLDGSAREVFLEEVPRGVLFVSVATDEPGAAVAVAGERNLGIAGLTNFRDLGGYQGFGGATVRWGRLFRSDALRVEEGAFERFAELGLKVVYDLRSEPERQVAPNRLPDGDHVVRHFSLVAEEETRPSALDSVDGETFLADLYTHMLENSARSVGAIVTDLAEEDLLPAVFHCAAGKDRTGLVAAIVLLALGVAEDDVLDDYELTSRYRSTEQIATSAARMEREGYISPELLAGLQRTPRWAMQSALTRIEEAHGGIAGYLSGPAGVAPGVVERLRANLLH